MSFSFSVKGLTKQEALEKVAVEMAKVVQGQPIHAKDEANVNAIAKTVADTVDGEIKEGQVMFISCSGSLSWTGGTTTPEVVMSASCNVSVSIGSA